MANIPIPTNEEIIGVYFRHRMEEELANANAQPERKKQVLELLGKNTNEAFEVYATAIDNIVNFAHYKLELQGDKAEHDSYNRSEINLQIYMLYNPYVWRALRDVKGVPNIGLVYTVCIMSFFKEVLIESALYGDIGRITDLKKVLLRILNLQPRLKTYPGWLDILQPGIASSIAVCKGKLYKFFPDSHKDNVKPVNCQEDKIERDSLSV